MADSITVTETTYQITVTEGDTQTVTVSPTESSITITQPADTTTSVTTPASQIVTITQSASIVGPFYTDEDARQAISVSGAGLSYNNTTGIVTYTQQLVPIDKGGTGSTTASAARTALGADNASNLTKGQVGSSLLTSVPVTTFSDVSIIDKTAGNIVYMDGANVTARDPSNWNLSDFTNDLASGDLPAHTHDAADITSGIFSILLIPDLSTSKITSGTFADARISSSSVTQHAGDIDLLDLGNVTGAIYGTGSGIYYDGANWVAGPLTATQIPSLDASKITTGTFADARISESSVTQHADAIELNDLGDVNIAQGAGNDGDLVYWDYASGAGAKFKGAARSSISLSEFNNDLNISSTEYFQHPDATTVRYFDDLISKGIDSSSNAYFSQVCAFGGSSWSWKSNYSTGIQDWDDDDALGVMWAQETGAYDRGTAYGPISVLRYAPSDGDKCLFECRVKFAFNASAVNSYLAVGFISWDTNDNQQNSDLGSGYSFCSMAGIKFQASDTYLQSFHRDNHGVAGGVTKADITSVTKANDTWYRMASVCTYDAANTRWEVDSYIDGTLVDTKYLTTWGPPPTYGICCYNNGSAVNNRYYVDWVSCEYTRWTNPTLLHLEDV